MPEEIQDLLTSMQMMIQYIEQNASSLNQPTQEALGLFIEETNQFLEEYFSSLENESSANNLNNIPLEPAGHQSAQINAFSYDPKTESLKVKFQGDYPNQNGSVYGYEGVPSYIFDLFRRGAIAPKTSGKNKWHEWKKGLAPSLGASMNALIKGGNYKYQRLS